MTDTAVTTAPVPPPSGIEAKEASRATGGVTSIVNGAFTLATTYGITYSANLPHHVAVLIMAGATFFAVVVPLAQAEITRGKVYSASSFAKAIIADAPAVIAAVEPVVTASEAVVKDVAPAAPDGAPVQPATPAPAV